MDEQTFLATLSKNILESARQAPIIGATVVADYARASLEAGADAAAGQGSRWGNWKIDEAQERRKIAC